MSVQPSRRPRRWKKPLLALGLLAGAPLVWVAFVFAYEWYTYSVLPTPALPGFESPPDELTTLFQRALIHQGEFQWTAAKERLLEVQARAPNHPGLSSYLARVEQEIANQEHLSAARAALAQKKLEVTGSELNKVLPNTRMFEQLFELKKELRDTAEARVNEAQNLYDLGELAQAVEIVQDVLAAFPEHDDAQRLLESSFGDDRGHLPVPPIEDASPPWDRASKRFSDGDLSGAMALAQSCASNSRECKSGLKDMKEFGALYKKLEDLDAKAFARLLDLDQRITGKHGSSKMARSAGTRAATSFYKSASAAKAKRQWARAVEYARRTLQVDPGHSGATQILAELRTQARDLMLGTHHAPDKNPESALAMWQQVLAMTEPDDELHQKAQNRIEAISR